MAARAMVKDSRELNRAFCPNLNIRLLRSGAAGKFQGILVFQYPALGRLLEQEALITGRAARSRDHDRTRRTHAGVSKTRLRSN